MEASYRDLFHWLTGAHINFDYGDEDFYCQLRQDDERKYLVAMNVNRDKWFKNVFVCIKDSGSVIEWDCRTGQQYSAATQTNNE